MATIAEYTNADFYVDGVFSEEAAKDACIALMAHHGYPTLSGIRENLWVSDAGSGQYAEVGFAAVVFLNHDAEDPGDRYMMLDIFLLPNQMLPEHYHVQTEQARPKFEGWLVRHGMANIVGEGEESPGLREKVPDSQRESIQAWHAAAVEPGGVAGLNRANAPHWQLAGPEGAILTEAGTYHDGASVRFTNPNLTL